MIITIIMVMIRMIIIIVIIYRSLIMSEGAEISP